MKVMRQRPNPRRNRQRRVLPLQTAPTTKRRQRPYSRDRFGARISTRNLCKRSNAQNRLSGKSRDTAIRLSVAITGASIRAARGDTANSLKSLDAVIKEAHKAKLIQLELEARLALAEIEIAISRIREGRMHLDELESEASQRGYKFIAERAAAARKKIPGFTAA
jgi:hypothetical protein